MRIYVGSKNPVKKTAVKEAFGHYFHGAEIISVDAPSGVSDQPFNRDTFTGAENRARFLYSQFSGSSEPGDYYTAVEGGVIELYGGWYALGCACIIDSEGRKGYGTSSWFPLPDIVITALKSGEELGHVIDRLAGEHNSKHRGGAIGYLTKGVIPRKDLYVPAVISALIPFNNPEDFFN